MVTAKEGLVHWVVAMAKSEISGGMITPRIMEWRDEYQGGTVSKRGKGSHLRYTDEGPFLIPLKECTNRHTDSLN